MAEAAEAKRKAARPRPATRSLDKGAAGRQDLLSAPLLSDEALSTAIAALREADAQTIGSMIKVCGMPPLRKRDAGFAGLVWIVVSQQVSTASAKAIYKRIEEHFETICAEHVLTATAEELKSCGLSTPKIRTLHALSHALVNGLLDLPALTNAPAPQARAALTAIHGIGPWTADIYLLFCLGHPDVWPSGDLALQEGVRLALGLRKRPDAGKLEKISRRWSPWRAAAARLVWHYYGAVKSVPAASSLAGKVAKETKK